MTLFKYCIAYHIHGSENVAVFCEAPNDSQAVETALDLLILILNDREYLQCEMTAPEIVCFGMVEPPEQFDATKEALKAMNKIRDSIHFNAQLASYITSNDTAMALDEFNYNMRDIIDDTYIRFNVLRVAYGIGP